MLNLKAKTTIYDKFGVENIRQCEEYVNICRPDKSSEVYKQFEQLINAKVKVATKWLAAHNIEYTWNERIDNHLYRLYIPEKDLLLDFEYYPVINKNYNYIRINYDIDIIQILEKVFPKVILDASKLDTYILNQKSCNKFLIQNNHSPIYYKDILRVGLCEGDKIYQCMIIRKNKIIVNVIENNCKVMYGNLILLRQLNEGFEIPEILITENYDNSYITDLYQLMHIPIISENAKKKIWWSPSRTCWHIDKSEYDKYIPFYFTEHVTYNYSTKSVAD